jgi:hypothetical protein
MRPLGNAGLEFDAYPLWLGDPVDQGRTEEATAWANLIRQWPKGQRSLTRNSDLANGSCDIPRSYKYAVACPASIPFNPDRIYSHAAFRSVLRGAGAWRGWECLGAQRAW